MRKADYTLLANILRANIERGEEIARRPTCSASLKNMAEQQAMTARRIAHDFANAASVDTRNFLMACGIVPP